MKFFKSDSFFPILLIAIVIMACIQNYKFDTYLSGWDTLHPEFNFPEYFKRILSVWQEHQGLGAVAAQAHASELPRVILLYLTSFILPLSFLRYFFFFVTLIAGPLGVYFFTKEFVSSKATAFLSGLFFLLNLTTIQQYSVPLEMFATLYGTIGWIFLFATRFLKHLKKRDLWLFVLLTVLSFPMAHTPTLFYIFFFCLSIYLIFLGFITKRIKQTTMLIFLMVALNSYWILPNVYFIKVYGASVANSKIHSQFSDRAFQVGKNFGGIPDTAIMKNFLFDWGEYNQKNGSFIHLLDFWNRHLSNFPVNVIGNFIFLLIILGVFISIVKRDKIGISLLPVFLLSYFFIANDNFLFDKLSQFLGSFLFVLKEALRFPFTKFSIILLFCYSVYFGLALNLILFKKSKFLSLFVYFFITLSFVFYMWPLTTGYLINPKMKVQIPKYYFEMFEWFNNQQPDSRIAAFPVHTFWGWSYYNWGFEGAGFLWFGLKQPLLNREFDRWHPVNEQFYWEISYAVYREDIKLLESVLDKYQVKYLLLDFAVTDASSAKSPYLNQLQKFLSASSKIKEDKSFGTVRIFKVENLTNSKDFLAAGSLPYLGPKYQWTDIDIGFLDYGQYVLGENPDIFYPFRSLFTNHTNQKMDFTLQETKDSFIFKKDIPLQIRNYNLNIPEFNSQMVWFDDKNLDSSGIFLPKVNFNGQSLVVEVPKIKGYFSEEINPAKKVDLTLPKNCDFLRLSIGDNSGEVKNQVIKEGSKDILRIISRLSNNCSAALEANNLSHNQSYIISFESKNVEGKTLLFWLENNNLKKSDIEVYLPQVKNLTKFYFIQPPLDQFGTGYTLHFDNWSFNKNYSVNDLGKVNIYPIPYSFLTNLFFAKDIPAKGYLESISSFHPLPYIYKAKIEKGSDHLVLYQSYDPGWQAFTVDGLKVKRLDQHLLINNWANGWKVSESGTIYIIFLPQLLQFLGFGILGLTVYWLIHKRSASL